MAARYLPAQAWFGSSSCCMLHVVCTTAKAQGPQMRAGRHETCSLFPQTNSPDGAGESNIYSQFAGKVSASLSVLYQVINVDLETV